LKPRTNQTSNSRSSKFLTWSFIFTAAAILVAGYLLWATTGVRNQLVGCGAGSGCDDVLGSRWSLWLGLPVSFFALTFYALLAVSIIAIRSGRIEGTKWMPWLTTCAWAAGIAILWFVFIQAAIIGRYCIYCLTDHVLGLLAIACLALHGNRVGETPGLAKGALSVLLAGAFITVHIFAAPTWIDEVEMDESGTGGAPMLAEMTEIGPAQRSRMVGLIDNRISFDIYKMPCIGSREAEYVIMEMFDYTCSHCRDLHRHLHDALERYGDQFAIVPLPVPMDKSCNPAIQFSNPKHLNACEYARYSMAVCAAAPDRFTEFHDWLMTGKKVTSVEKAREQVEAVVGKDKFKDAIEDPLVEEWMNDGITMYKITKLGGIPKLVVDAKVVTVPQTTPEKLFEFLESTLGMEPRGDVE